MADNNKTPKNNNPRNQDSALFKRLTRLFSGPLVDYDRPAVIRGSRRDVTKYTFTSSTGREFKKKEYYNPFSGQTNKILWARNKQLRYTDFDQMEYMPEIASGLDIYADEITTSTTFNPIVEVECHNREIKDIIHTLLYKVLNVEANLFGWTRSMCKYGDYYLYLDIDDTIGITNVIPLPVRELERIEGTDPTNPNYIQFFWQNAEGQKGVTFENWQVSHFRVVGSDKYVPYGTSVLEPSRRIWRQLVLLEDAMMAYRIVRSPERRVFYIDVGNIAPEDVEQYIEQVKTQMKRNQIVDDETGRVDLRYNAMSVDEDFYIPVRGSANNTRIETLAGGQFTGDIDDVNYLRDKLFSALKIPKAYLAQSDAQEDKTTLAQKDIRFARTIQRLQRVVIAELEKMCIVHLFTLGFRNNDLLSFTLHLNNPSKIAELQELEHLRTKFEIAGNATEGLFSRRWVYQNVFKLSNEEVERIQIEQIGDAKYTSDLEAISAEQVGGDLTGDTSGDLGDILGDTGDAPETPGEGEGEDEGPLLASPDEGGDVPGQRDDASVSDGHRHGAMYRHLQSLGGKYVAYPGSKRLVKGADELGALAKGRITTGESLTQGDEEIILETQYDIKKLIEQLEQHNEDKA
jgi:hypothetical protein